MRLPLLSFQPPRSLPSYSFPPLPSASLSFVLPHVLLLLLLSSPPICSKPRPQHSAWQPLSLFLTLDVDFLLTCILSFFHLQGRGTSITLLFIYSSSFLLSSSSSALIFDPHITRVCLTAGPTSPLYLPFLVLLLSHVTIISIHISLLLSPPPCLSSSPSRLRFCSLIISRITRNVTKRCSSNLVCRSDMIQRRFKFWNRSARWRRCYKHFYVLDRNF